MVLFSLYFSIQAHFINIRPNSCRFIKSDLNAVQAKGQSAWIPRVLYVWKISIFGLLDGLDLLNISWSIVTMCAYCAGNGIFNGDFIITCLWIFFKT